MDTRIVKEKWKITHMDQWDIEPGWYIELDGRGSGSLHFLCVDVVIDYDEFEEYNNGKRIEFTFIGNDEYDEISGRGWVETNGKKLQGFIRVHQGYSSEFEATLIKPQKTKLK
jgi:hypothetical protein